MKTYPVLIAVDHDGKKYKPGGSVDLTDEQAAPLLRTGFLGKPTDNVIAQDTGSPEPDNAGAVTNTESELDRLVAAIGTIDKDNKELWTGSGKPKTEAFHAIETIDFPVSAALRDKAWDQFNAQA
ncbi:MULTISPECIES: hypothetical protein [Thalassospira]|uniref:hypothetical protein n=1 Tax=Thalassospira TaxID=168934 RepID=UPI000C4A52E5|nr:MULTISPECIES: hypothetical protein [Thalassospira]MAB32235.1 hypothetical protein [Thalassospira sp.]HBS22701.1 hypothetical protein [Thalassospira sp.]|tara:strand:+ start:1213 stop:1587 length:375 start_codon:yes stop_codon:yes gene_type:complete